MRRLLAVVFAVSGCIGENGLSSEAQRDGGGGGGGANGGSGGRGGADSDAAPGTCTPGRASVCPCPGGGDGIQTCGSAGTFGPCECGPAPDAPDARANDGGLADGGAPDANLSSEPGERQEQPCGLNDRGVQSRLCEGGVFGAFSACADPHGCGSIRPVVLECGNPGRLWLIEAEWQEGKNGFTDVSRDLTAYMIVH